MSLSVDKIAEQIYKGRMYHGGSSSFSLVLDDLLFRFTEGQFKHSNNINDKTQSWLDETFNMISGLYKIEDPFHDPLGDIYEAMTSKWGRDALGQFFTPWHLCRLMTGLVGPSTEDVTLRYESKGLLTSFQECAVGSGRLALAPMQSLFLDDPSTCKYMHLVLIDKDITCVKMTAINFIAAYLFHGVQAGLLQIYHGDTLTMDLNIFMETHDSDVDKAIALDAQLSYTQTAA